MLALFEQGVLAPSAGRDVGVRRAAEAFRFMREARHVGKIVLTIPQPPDPQGTVLITGGTGRLGALVARHLATVHGARHCCWRAAAGRTRRARVSWWPSWPSLAASARGGVRRRRPRSGWRADRLDPPERPLTSVIHAAGVLDDGLIESLSAEQVERVMRRRWTGRCICTS